MCGCEDGGLGEVARRGGGFRLGDGLARGGSPEQEAQGDRPFGGGRGRAGLRPGCQALPAPGRARSRTRHKQKDGGG